MQQCSKGSVVQKSSLNQESSNSLLKKLGILVAFVAAMLAIILYFYDSTPDIKSLIMKERAEQFSTSVTNAHWQWQAEGKPQIVMLIHYEKSKDNPQSLVEKDRRPILMSHIGWPKTDPTSEGCAKLWQMILNQPLEVDGFRVFAEYFSDANREDGEEDSKCRFRLSVGPKFEYRVLTGEVSEVKS